MNFLSFILVCLKIHTLFRYKRYFN